MIPTLSHSCTLIPQSRSVALIFPNISDTGEFANDDLQAFCAEIDQDDKQTMPDFLARLAGYIEREQSAPPTLDDEPRIRPMPGTIIDDLIPEDAMEDPPLLRYESDAESSDGDALEPMQHMTMYWKPRNGRIGILPHMYAKEITQSTGSSLFAEEAEKRYRIFQGNIKLALEKLLRLEPLLVSTLTISKSIWADLLFLLGSNRGAVGKRLPTSY